MECLSSKRCAANLDLLLPYLKSRKCFWNQTLNGLPVWPVYFILHVGQVNWYIPLFSYLLLVCSCLVVRSFPMVLSVPKVTLTLVFFNIFIMSLVSLPTYVNLTHFVFSSLCLCPFLVFNVRRIDVSYLLLFRIFSIVLCFFPYSQVLAGMRPFYCAIIWLPPPYVLWGGMNH